MVSTDDGGHAMKTEGGIIDAERIERAIQQRYSPFPEMTMELLSSQLNAFRVGELRPAARTWEIMLERDGDLAVPADKLFSDIARLPWEIEQDDDSDEAEQHAAALKYFYANLTATSVLDADETGGINLLLRQLMTAHAYRYSIHEIVLQISSASKKEITATFTHAPVWFFEARKGRLGYLRQDFAIYGEPLLPGEWLPAVGRGMMRQCSVGYICKWRPLADWLLFSYRFGLPGIHGETDAPRDSTEWNNFVAAVAAFANDWATVTSRTENGGAKISLIETAKGGGSTLPFPELIERTDRLYARAFRGGDLSTQSREGGDVAGANPQEGEKQIILEDGGQWATDILNVRVDEPIIKYLFNTLPKAWICLRPPKQKDANREINILKAARELSVPVSIDTARDRLELPTPEEGEDLISAPQPDLNLNPNLNLNPAALANEAADTTQLAAALAEKRDPFLAALDRISRIENEQAFLIALNEFYARMPVMIELATADAAKAQRALEQLTAPALAKGLEGK